MGDIVGILVSATDTDSELNIGNEHNPLGIVPVNKFASKLNASSFVAEFNHSGIVPVNLFSPIYKVCNILNWLHDDGIVPVN